MTALLIGLTGAAGAGKDESAAALRRAGWQCLAFADALRIEVAEAWAVPIMLFVGRAGKELAHSQLCVGYCGNPSFLRWAVYCGHSLHAPRSPRWVMQQWGMFRREQNPGYWVMHANHWVQHHMARGHTGLALTDVRMANELAMLHHHGGHLVRVHRPHMSALPADTANHDSEGHISLRADAAIHNDGDLQHLEAEVWRVVQHLAGAARKPTACEPTTEGDPHA